MSKITYIYPTPTHKIILTHFKRRHPKHKYFIETIDIECFGLLPNNGNYQILLSGDTAFMHFSGIAEFYQYIKKNKNKDIVDIDQRGFLKFIVKGEDGSYETETININQSNTLEEKPKREYISKNATQFFEKKAIQSIKESLKAYVKEKAEISQPNIRNQNALFTLSTNPTVPQEVDGFNPTFELDIKREDFELRGIKIKIGKITADRLYFGIGYSVKGQRVRYWCEFQKISMSSLTVKEGHSLQAYLEDENLVIRNIQNNNGRKFEQSNFDQCQGYCFLFVSLTMPTEK